MRVWLASKCQLKRRYQIYSDFSELNLKAMYLKIKARKTTAKLVVATPMAGNLDMKSVTKIKIFKFLEPVRSDKRIDSGISTINL